MIYCFDIDGVICNTKKLNYKEAKPIKNSINVINKLYLKGHTIKIFTGRYSQRCKMNLSKIKKMDNGLTKKQLKKWNVFYHKLYFGKPSFDIYIDDKNFNFSKNWYLKSKFKNV